MNADGNVEEVSCLCRCFEVWAERGSGCFLAAWLFLFVRDCIGVMRGVGGGSVVECVGRGAEDRFCRGVS